MANRKTKAQLEQELQDANARIEELERELAVTRSTITARNNRNREKSGKPIDEEFVDSLLANMQARLRKGAAEEDSDESDSTADGPVIVAVPERRPRPTNVDISFASRDATSDEEDDEDGEEEEVYRPPRGKLTEYPDPDE
jgi:hypothetical protein